MKPREYVTGGRRGRRKKPKKQAFTVEITEDAMSVQLDPRAIAEALAAEASEVLQTSLETSKRRLKKVSRERRVRAGIHSAQFWKQTGKLIREVHFKPAAGGAEVVVTRPLNGRQMGMALTDAGLRGKRRQETIAAMERRVVARLVSGTEREERADDAALSQLLRRNRKGLV